MKSTSNHDLARICAENISFLYLLHSVPTPPSRNTLETQKNHVKGYALSLEEERRLVESLAFLANDCDDVNHIPALCIEQNPTAFSLHVLLAVNCLGWESGASSLRRLKKGFDSVFTLLVDVWQKTEDDVFNAIVAMCTKRILLRLGLARRKRGVPKQTIQQTLRCAIDCLRNRSIKTLDQLYRPSILFIEKAKLVIRLADNWVKHQTFVRLRELVDSVYHLKRTVDIEALLGVMTTRDMNPSSRTSLINTVSKIARYREISRYLYRMSKKNTMFRQMRTMTIDLPMEAYVRPSRNRGTSTLGSVVARTKRSYRKEDVARICRLIRTTEADANQVFTSQVLKILKESKIHAEIQLLYHLELNPPSLPPRVVASSKDACYLCNSFILMHGKMHTARTHGRLYPGWRLPSMPNLMSLEQRFQEFLGNQIDASITTLFSRGRRTVYPDPNESTLLTLPYSESTIRSLLVAPDEAAKQKSVTPLHTSTAGTEVNTDTAISTPKQEPPEEEPPEEEPPEEEPPEEEPPEEEPLEEEPPEEESPEEESPEESGDGINQGYAEGTKDERKEDSDTQADCGYSSVDQKDRESVKSAPQVTPVTTEPAPNNDSVVSTTSTPGARTEVVMTQGHIYVLEREAVLIVAGKLHLHMNYPVQATTYSLTWLNNSEAERLVAREEVFIARAENLDKEITYEVDHHGNLYIAARGAVVRITAGSV